MYHVVFLRNLLKFSKPYANTIAESMLHFPDTPTKANITEFRARVNAGDAAKRDRSYNSRCASRQKLLAVDKTKNLFLPLNR